MYGHFVVYFTSIICLQLTQSVDVLDSNDNVYCKPFEQIVSVSSTGLPYFVVLHQCQGSIRHHHPEHKKCTFNKFEEVRVKITNGGHTDKQEYVTLKNHTSCKEECVKKCRPDLFVQNEKNCECTCQHTLPPPGFECGKNHSWDDKECKCKCKLNRNNAPYKKKLDEEKCQFVCANTCPPSRILMPDTCRCARRPSTRDIRPVVSDADSDNSHQGKVLAALVIGEFVFLYLIFDFLLYSKQAGLMYYVRDKCRRRPNADPAQPAEARRCLENGDEASNLPLQDVVVDRKGETHLAQHVSST